MTANETGSNVPSTTEIRPTVVVGAGSAGASLILELCQSSMRDDIKGVVHIDHAQEESGTLRKNLNRIGFDADEKFRNVHLQHTESDRAYFEIICEDLNLETKFGEPLNSNSPGIRIVTRLYEDRIINTIKELLPTDGAGGLGESRVVYVFAVTGITSSTVALEAGELFKEHLNNFFKDNPLTAGEIVPSVGIALMSPNPTLGAIQDNLPHGRKVCEVMSHKLANEDLPFDNLLMVDGSGFRNMDEGDFTTWAGGVISSLLHARNFDAATNTMEVHDTEELLNALPDYANIAFMRTGWTDNQLSVLRYLDKLDDDISKLRDDLEQLLPVAEEDALEEDALEEDAPEEDAPEEDAPERIALEEIKRNIGNYEWQVDSPSDMDDLESFQSFRHALEEMSSASTRLVKSFEGVRDADDNLNNLNICQRIFARKKYEEKLEEAEIEMYTARKNLSEKRETLKEWQDRIISDLDVFWESLRVRRMQVIPSASSGLGRIRSDNNPLIQVMSDSRLQGNLTQHRQNELVRVVNPQPGNRIIMFERAQIMHTGPEELVTGSLEFPVRTYQTNFLEEADRGEQGKVLVHSAKISSALVDALIFWESKPREGFRVFARHYLQNEINLPLVPKDAWPNNSESEASI